MSQITYGTVFGFGPASPPAAVAGVISISMDGIEITQVPTKTIDQADRWFTFLNGMVNGGTFSVKLDLLKAAIATMMSYVGHPLPYFYKITTNGASSLAGNGNLKSFTPLDIPEDDKVTSEISIQLTGIAIWTP